METTSRRRSASSCSGFSTGMQTMVVQFGLATMPLGMSARSSPFTSGTTSGTSGSIRHAFELSMTIAPAAATTGAQSREAGAPMLKRAMSMPLWSATATSSTVDAVERPARPSALTRRAADGPTGSPRSRRIWRMTPPTWPVAP